MYFMYWQGHVIGMLLKKQYVRQVKILHCKCTLHITYCRTNRTYSNHFDFYFVSDSSEVINLLFFFHMILLKSSYISGFDHICSQNGWFTSNLWWNDGFLFRKFIRFPNFFPRIFSDFHQIFRFLHKMDCLLLLFSFQEFFLDYQ